MVITGKIELYVNESEQNTTYQLLKKHYPDMPSYIKAALNNIISKNYKND